MSFGDPNNPYGQQQPPQQPQPGYGYPQDQYQGQQPGYGYPQAPPVQQPYGAGYPGVPTEMPGGVKAARIMLFILGGLQVLGAIAMVALGGWVADQMSNSSELGSDADTAASAMTGVMVVVGILTLGVALWAILTAAKFRSGGNGIRISAIVYGSLTALFSLFSLLTANVLALISLALGILIIVFCAKQEASTWFQRPRH